MSFDRNGMTTKRLPELLQDIQDRQVAAGFNFDYQNNKIIYQINSVFGASVAEIHELLEIVYNSLELAKAEGVWLDSLGLLRGTPRIQAENSYTNSQYVILGPTDSVPAGSIWSSSEGNYKATNPSSIVGSTSSSFETLLRFSNDIDAVPEGEDYSLVINAVTYTYTSLLGDLVGDVVDGIKAVIDSDTNRTFTATRQDNSSDGVDLLLTPDPDLSLSSVVLSSYISTIHTKVYGRVEVTINGPIEISAGGMENFESPIPGVISTSNDDAYILGRDQETDAELRIRVAQGPVNDCTGTVLSIESALLNNIQGVTTALVAQNVTLSPTDSVPVLPYFPDGTPFGAYQTLVVGGGDEEVAQEVWRTSPANAPLIGNTQVNIVDSSGKPRVIHFSRPEQIHLAYEIDYSKYSEEDYPADGDQGIQDAAVSYTNGLGLDYDVINGRVKCAIRDAVSRGIDSLTVRVQQISAPGEAPNPANWQETAFPISASQYASTTAQDVTVTDIT